MYGNVVFGANFTQLQKKKNSCCIFPVSEKAFAKFSKFSKYFATFRHRKKRKKRRGWDIILHILDTVKLFFHSLRVELCPIH
jgi:hypothetical protein